MSRFYFALRGVLVVCRLVKLSAKRIVNCLALQACRRKKVA